MRWKKVVALSGALHVTTDLNISSGIREYDMTISTVIGAMQFLEQRIFPV